jgi:hypothetical protein
MLQKFAKVFGIPQSAAGMFKLLPMFERAPHLKNFNFFDIP